MAGIKNKLTLAQALTKYSDKYIYSQIAGNLKIQVEQGYHNNLKLKTLKSEITKKLAELRDACADLDVKSNREIALNFMAYFNGKDARNAQFRGIQSELANQIYRDVTIASGVDLSKYDHELSAVAFGTVQSLNTRLLTYVPRVIAPASYSKAGPDSLKQGHEYMIVSAHSSMTGSTNTITDDKNIIYNNTTKPVITNHNQKNNDFDSEKDASIVKNDIKTLPINKVIDQGVEGKVASVDTADEKTVIVALQTLATIALNTFSISKVKHVDPTKNNPHELAKVLTHVKITGDVVESTKIVKFPIIITSKYTTENDS